MLDISIAKSTFKNGIAPQNTIVNVMIHVVLKHSTAAGILSNKKKDPLFFDFIYNDELVGYLLCRLLINTKDKMRPSKACKIYYDSHKAEWTSFRLSGFRR